jgi:REP element-mobilizing transposase RayT
MPYDPQRHHRRSIRLDGHDYTSPGAYFVTICTHGRMPLFGEVVDGEMRFTSYGRVADTNWARLPRHFPHVALGAWVVMPNHVHGIIVIVDEQDAGNGTRGRGEAFPAWHSETEGEGNSASLTLTSGASRNASPLQEPPVAAPGLPHGTPSGSIGAVVGNYKSITARRINHMRGAPGARVWQRNYWEHIIRDETAHQNIRAYILNNPARWNEDRLHPDACQKGRP